MKRMNPILSITLTLSFLASLIACGEENRQAVHDAVDDVYEQVEMRKDEFNDAMKESASDLESFKIALDARADRLSESAVQEYRERLVDLEDQRRALDERMQAAQAAGAEAWKEWRADAAEFSERCAAAWEAFKAADDE